MGELTLSIGAKCGCLEIIDDGLEYQQLIDAKISCIEEEKSAFLNAINEDKLQHQDWYDWDKKVVIPAFIYEPQNFKMPYPGPVRVTDFEEAIDGLRIKSTITHYKCSCRKCGKIRYYAYETLQKNPRYCFMPIYCSSKSSHSTKAANASFWKRQQYEKDESVCLVDDRNETFPSEKYCGKWNDERKEKLRKQAEKESSIIASLPRVYANNYDKNYVGRNYESLEILECLTDSLEDVPIPRFTQRHQKIYGEVKVYKQYRCRCYLCGKEQNITCDKFGIYPPTPYGYRAYDGYWSDVSCDCHPISSFQWIVNKLLFENNIHYQVEYSFPDLYGTFGKKRLRFDFAVFDDNLSLKCLIECQGEQHYGPVDEFGGESQFDTQVQNETLKREFAKAHNIPLIEISYKRKNIDSIKTVLIENSIL